MENRDMTLVAVVFKSMAEFQLSAILRHVIAEKVVLFYEDSSGRLNDDTVRSWSCIRNFPGNVVTESIDSRQTTVHNFRARVLAHGRPTHIAMPLVAGVPFWANAWYFRRFAQVINISDGSSENTTIRDSFYRLKFRWNKPFTRLKTLLLPPIIGAIGKADVCYHPFAPTYDNCFAYQTFPVDLPIIDRERHSKVIDLLRGQKNSVLIVGGFDFPAERLARELEIKSWVATSKDREIWINGERHALDVHFCAEELLEIFRPKAVVGYASEAILAARFRYPDLPCFAILTPEIDKRWGARHNEMYQKQNRKSDVRMIAPHNIHYIKDELWNAS